MHPGLLSRLDLNMTVQTVKYNSSNLNLVLYLISELTQSRLLFNQFAYSDQLLIQIRTRETIQWFRGIVCGLVGCDLSFFVHTCTHSNPKNNKTLFFCCIQEWR